jgi:hypothetical protein
LTCCYFFLVAGFVSKRLKEMRRAQQMYVVAEANVIWQVSNSSGGGRGGGGGGKSACSRAGYLATRK